jgi:hypothetical protein
MPRIPRPSPALLVALLALVVATSGASYALTIPRNSVGAPQLKKNAVTSAKVKDGSLTAADFGGVLPAGPAGPQGAQGPAGPAGPAGSAATFAGQAAGGSLSGTYPAPAIANDAITSAQVADGGLRLADVASAVSTYTIGSGATAPAHGCYSVGIGTPASANDLIVASFSGSTVTAGVVAVAHVSASSTIVVRACNITDTDVNVSGYKLRYAILKG